MREIKFRGYSYANGGWLYGNLIEKDDPEKEIPTPWCRLIQNRALTAELVVYESVGQFTGLTDKNGKDIYEGDICKTYEIDVGNLLRNVVFDSGSFGFKHDFMLFCELRGFKRDYIEVVGNIYQHTETL